MRIFVGILMSMVLATTVHAEDITRRIVVAGMGEVQAAPDMATVSIGVSHEARTAGEAMEAASLAMSSVMTSLAAAGVEPRDIQTSNIGLNPRYQHSNDGRPPRVTGYIASTTLTVRVRMLDDLGGVLDAVVSDGANALNGLRFGIADTAPLESAARAAAVADAAAKARELADAAGVQLGRVISISEGGAASQPQPMMRGAMMEAAMDVPVAAGELDFRARVNVVYAIAD